MEVRRGGRGRGTRHLAALPVYGAPTRCHISLCGGRGQFYRDCAVYGDDCVPVARRRRPGWPRRSSRWCRCRLPDQPKVFGGAHERDREAGAAVRVGPEARGVRCAGCTPVWLRRTHCVPKGIMVGSRACEEGLGDDRIRFNGKGWVAVSTTVVGGAAG